MFVVIPGLKPRIKKGFGKTRRVFKDEEDNCLRYLVEKYGTRNWELISKYMRGRTPRQCRERWNGYLSPDLNTGQWSEAEDQKLLRLVAQHGNKWSTIAQEFPDRSAANIKNRWYAHLEKRLRMPPPMPKELTMSIPTVDFFSDVPMDMDFNIMDNEIPFLS